VRRRRVFVRAEASGTGSVVTIGGLARTDASGGFEDEFAALAGELAAAGSPSTGAPGAGPPGAEPPGAEPLGKSPEPNNQSETGA
jgi:hypothetical protein